MAEYESGVSYEALKAMVDAGVLDSLGNGSLLKARDKWRGVLTYYVDVDGQRKQVRISHTFSETKISGRGATSKTVAKKLLAEWREKVLADARAIAGLDHDPTRPTRECVKTFIDSKLKTDKDGNLIGARRSTITFYRSCAKRLEASPSLANKPLSQVRKSDVQQWVDTLSETLAKKSITDALNILSQTCADVLGDASNPCKGVKVLKNVRQGKRGVSSGRPNALSADNVARLNTLLDERESKYDGIDLMTPGVRIALHTGMRAEEVAGLRWRDVDLVNGSISVVNVIERAEADGKHIEFDAMPKTSGSMRVIPMDSELVRVLTEHRARVMEALNAIPKNDRPDVEGLYVIGQLDGSHYSPHRLGINFKKFCRVRNVIGTEGDVIGFHDLRHTYASLGLAQHPERLSEISATLGHSKVTTTLNIYVGRDRQQQKTFVESMTDVFSARIPEDVLQLRNGTDN